MGVGVGVLSWVDGGKREQVHYCPITHLLPSKQKSTKKIEKVLGAGMHLPMNGAKQKTPKADVLGVFWFFEMEMGHK